MTLAVEPWVESVVGRESADIPVPQSLGRVFVTGASGSIGSLVVPMLRDIAEDVATTDLVGDVDHTVDISSQNDSGSLSHAIWKFNPDVVMHLAGAKHAPEGETDPLACADVNIYGTARVCRMAKMSGARVVLASTCKACDPETAYGATKLIAERMVLNHSGVVVRFYNVVETSGNVFEIWRSIPIDQPIGVAGTCNRIFITAREATSLALWACGAPSGRYVVDGVKRRSMASVAEDVWPGRPIEIIAPRRGDRLTEPFAASSEVILSTDTPGVARVVSPHDPIGEE